MCRKTELFEKQLQKFYDSSLLKEVYRTEKAIVCNVYNQYYLAFSLDILKNYTENFPCFKMLNSSGLLEVVRNDSFVNEYYSYLSPEQKSKILTILNDDLFAQLSSQKEALLQLPVPEKINLEFEREVMANGRKAIKGLKWMKYFFRFLTI